MKRLLYLFLIWVFFIPIQAQKTIGVLIPCDRASHVVEEHELSIIRDYLKYAVSATGNIGIINQEVDLYLQEQRFQQICDLSDYNIYKLSTIVQMDCILVSSINKTANEFILSAYLVDVQANSLTDEMQARAPIVDGILPSFAPLCQSVVEQLLRPKPKAEPTKDSKKEETIQLSKEELMLLLQANNQESKKEQKINAVLGQVVVFPDGTRGLCFYLDNNGHGLAVSLDQADLVWDANRKRKIQDIVAIPNQKNVENFVVGHGLTYTNAILTQNSPDKAPAAAWCRMHGQDWYLPSVEEMHYLLSVANQGRGKKGDISKAIVKNGGVSLDEKWYWTSTENDDDEALCVGNNGKISSDDKDEDIPIRAMRAF